MTRRAKLVPGNVEKAADYYEFRVANLGGNQVRVFLRLFPGHCTTLKNPTLPLINSAPARMLANQRLLGFHGKTPQAISAKPGVWGFTTRVSVSKRNG